MNYWLLKTEPTTFSISDLKREKITSWEGVRNYQARNFLLEMQPGDVALIYHSSTAQPSVVGTANVVAEAYPDKTARQQKSQYYDPRSTVNKPIWYTVDIEFTSAFKTPVSLEHLKGDPFFADMMVIRPGMRLSIQPVSKKHFDHIIRLAH